MKKLYPVVHVETLQQAQENAKVAYDAGADGVFLINHSISSETLFRIHKEVSDQYKDQNHFDIGINCLDLTPFELIFQLDDSIPMIWVDNCLVDEDTVEQKEAAAVRQAIDKCNWKGQYFGGTAFKYQKPVKNLELTTLLALKYVDVVTTSGPGTGKAASLEKIYRMRQELGTKSLAIASGITVENVVDYLPFVDIFLVSTGISKDFLNLDPKLTTELASLIHLYRK